MRFALLLIATAFAAPAQETPQRELLSKRREGALVSGTVLDVKGAPWVGAEVRFRPYPFPRVGDEPLSEHVTATTDQDGEFTVELAPAVYQVWAAAPASSGRYRVTSERQVVAPFAGLVLREGAFEFVQRRLRFAGRWLEKPLRVQVAGLCIEADERGEIALPLLPIARWSLGVLDSEDRLLADAVFAPTPRGDAVLEVSGEPAEFEIEVRDGAGNPVAGAEICVDKRPWVAMARSDANGRARLSFAPPISLEGLDFLPWFLVRAPGLAGRIVRPEQDERELQVELDRAALMRGRLTADGERPFSRQPIALYGSMETAYPPLVLRTDDTGRFAFEVKPDEPYRLCALLALDTQAAIEGLRDEPVWPEAVLHSGVGGVDLGDISPSRLHRLEVTVLGMTGKPAAGAAILFNESAPEIGAQLPPLRAATDAQGRAVFLLPRGMKLCLAAALEGAFAVLQHVLPAFGQEASRSRLLLRLEEHAIAGKVVDEKGKPVGGALVSVYPRDMDESEDAVLVFLLFQMTALLTTGTAADGSFCAPVGPLPASYVAYAEHESARGRSEVAFTGGSVDDIVIVITPPWQPTPEPEMPTDVLLHVQVIGRETGQALPGYRVILSALDDEGIPWSEVPDSRGGPGKAPVTDKDGQVVLDVPSGKEISLSIEDPDGFRPLGWRLERGKHGEIDVPALRGGEERTVTIDVPAAADLTFHGRVIDSTTQQPVVGARVALGHVSHTTERAGKLVDEERFFQEVTADADGRFELITESWKRLDARIEAPGYTPLSLGLAKGRETRDRARIVELKPAGKLEVRVVDGRGQPVTDFKIRLWTEGYHLSEGDDWSSLPSLAEPEWTGECGPDGCCVFEEAPTGAPLAIELYRGRKLIRQEAERVELGPAEERSITLKIGAGFSVRGVLLDEKDTPIAGQALWLKSVENTYTAYFEPWDDDVVARTKTAHDGRFEFADVASGGWWIGPAPDMKPDPNRIAPAGTPVLVQDADQEIVLRAYRGLYIRGRVIDPTGQPVADVFVSSVHEGMGMGPHASTEEDGTFNLGPLVAGRYWLETGTFGGELAPSEPVEAEAGAVDVILTMLRGCKAKGRVVTESGEPVACDVRASPLDDEDSYWVYFSHSAQDGFFEFGGWPPGTYQFLACAGERFGFAGPVELAAGHPVDGIVLELQPGGKVRITNSGSQRSILEFFYKNVAVDSTGLAAGESKTVNVPAGQIEVRVRRMQSHEMEKLQIDVRVGETTEITVSDPP
ncbi:MAG: carboxypeptidase-like regulatory domain-containing protein [Planctomycetota bacterium]